jgi:hypothetical protein
MLSHLKDSESAEDENYLPYVKILLHTRLLYNSSVEVRFALMGQPLLIHDRPFPFRSITAAMKPVADLHKSPDDLQSVFPRSES